MTRRRKRLSPHEKRMLIVQCACLAYRGQPPLPQADIAAKLGIDPSYVSRYLKLAKEGGIVKTEIVLPREDELQLQLKREYRLQDAIVLAIDENFGPRQETSHVPWLDTFLGQEAAKYIEDRTNLLGDGIRVGLSGGSALLELTLALTKGRFKNLTISPLEIESLPEFVDIAPDTIVGLFRAKFHEDSRAYAPQFMKRSYSEPLAKTPDFFARELHTVRQMAKDLDLAIVGIEAVDSGKGDWPYAQMLRQLGVTARDLKQLDIVGAMIGRPYDSYGNDRFDDIEALRTMTLTLELDVLRRLAEAARPVVAIAGGRNKVDAIAVALKARYVNVLITDSVTASAVLEIRSRSV